MTAPDPLLIELRDVRKIFTTDEMETHALGGVELEIQRGEYVSIEGPSGSGKTTLLSILGLLDTPTAGTYRLAGELASASRWARARASATGRSASYSRRST